MVLIELTTRVPRDPRIFLPSRNAPATWSPKPGLYRQTAARTGRHPYHRVLDELERVLVDITHAPSNMTPDQLEALRQRLEAEGILFKFACWASNVRIRKLRIVRRPARHFKGQGR